MQKLVKIAFLYFLNGAYKLVPQVVVPYDEKMYKLT